MKKIGKVIIGIGISGSIMTSAAAAAIIWSGDSSEKLVAKTQFDLKPIILKVKETKIPIGFYSISEAPLEIADFIKKRFLSEGEDIESLSGVPNIKDGIITTTITYKTLAGQIKTKTFVFGGWHKAPSIDQRNTKLLAEFAAVLPRMPETPIEEQYKQEFQTLKKVRKRILDRIYTYSIPTIEYLKPLIDEFQILIDQFNRGIQDSWTLEERLESIAIEPEYISTQGQTVTPGFPTYNAPSLTRAAKEQLEKYVQEKLLVKNLAHVYNEKLKEADLAAMIAITSANLLKYINQLKAIIIPTKVVFKDMATIRYFNSYTLPTNIEDLTIEQVKEEIVKAKAAKTDNNAYNRDINAKHKYKLLVDKLLEEQKDHLKKIIIEPEYVSIQGQRLTLAYPIYERPALKDATPQQLEQFIEEKVAVQKAAHIYNDKLKKADLYASENLLKYVNQLKAIIVPTKVVFSGITTSLTFNVYTVPSDIDDLTLEQIKKEIIKAKAAKTQNIAYNKDINAKYKLSADKLLQEQKNHLTSIIIEHEYISTQGQIMTPGYPNYTGHLLMGATLQEVEQYIRDKLAIQRLANSYNTKLKEADLVAKNLMISKARWKLKIPVLPLLGNKDPVEYGILADFRVSIISKIDDNSINTEETLNIENDKYK
ncbi:MAG: hypothetical protein KAG14_04645, partial [Mycoplasmataceae bacterium]|nr:hypothetical protein [Mycoplasmataceae bacterium]